MRKILYVALLALACAQCAAIGYTIAERARDNEVLELRATVAGHEERIRILRDVLLSDPTR